MLIRKWHLPYVFFFKLNTNTPHFKLVAVSNKLNGVTVTIKKRNIFELVEKSLIKKAGTNILQFKDSSRWLKSIFSIFAILRLVAVSSPNC